MSVGRPYQSINITFASFEMQGPASDGTCIDYLQFFKDDDKKVNLTDRLCGSLANFAEEYKAFTIEQEYFTLHMVSDSNLEGPGFEFSYEAFEDFHGLDPDDLFIDDGSSTASDMCHYNCLTRWLILVITFVVSVSVSVQIQ